MEGGFRGRGEIFCAAWGCNAQAKLLIRMVNQVRKNANKAMSISSQILLFLASPNVNLLNWWYY